MQTEYVPSIDDTQEVLNSTSTWADEVVVSINEMDKRTLWKDKKMVSFKEYGIIYDHLNKPICPYLKKSTGKKGRGSLGKWGVNHAADPLITRKYNNGKYAVLVIFRGDQEGFVPALPGGMVDVTNGRVESYNRTLKRELCEEAINDDKKEAITQLKKAMDHGKVVYCGFVDDPRTTDNAWIETYCLHAHIDENVANGLNLRTEGTMDNETKGAVWMDFTADNMAKMYAGHGAWVTAAISLKDAEHMVDSGGYSFVISIFFSILFSILVAFVANFPIEDTIFNEDDALVNTSVTFIEENENV